MGFDPRAGGRIWGFIVFVPAMLLAFFGLFLLLIWSYTGLGFKKHRAKGCNLWGRVMLGVFGVRVDVVGGEHLTSDGPLIITFNHQSVMDIAMLAVCWPRVGSVLYKQEFHNIPIMGRLMQRLGMIPVDRGNRERALQSLDEAAKRVREGGMQLLVSPEGTRSRTGGLAPFKRGPFHLAAQTHAPLVPMVFHGVRELMPQGTWVPRTGRVRIECLEPIDTSDWVPSEVGTYSKQLRALYLEVLPDPPQLRASAS